MTKVFIVSPGAVTSGGPEVLHQLGDLLNHAERRAWMLYSPLGEHFEVPAVYQRYNVTPSHVGHVGPGSIVVLPETCAPMIRLFPGCRIYFWWLSVDNLYRVARYQPPLGILGVQRTASRQVEAMRNGGVHHLYQSEYARQFCEKHSLTSVSHLGDYIADEYLRAAAQPRGAREDLVVYNPAKGRRRTESILNALDVQAVPIQNMARSEVLALLSRAKVYLDFGGHPGKDRIPREAVAAGCCILTNLRGAAGNGVDVPIPEEFKIDDHRRGFYRGAVDRIHALVDGFDTYAPMFDAYRDSIAAERDEFRADVKMIFE